MSDADYYLKVPKENAVCRIKEDEATIRNLHNRIVEVKAERDALLERLAVHEQIAKEFIAKVESGRARSKQTYDAMKAALKGERDE